jgi:hypothetical protein
VSTGSPPHRWTTPVQRALAVTFFGFCALSFLAQALDPGKGGPALAILSILFSAGCGVLTYRGARWATLATQSGLTYRSIFRTRRWSWEQIDHLYTQDGLVGILGYRRRVLWLRTSSGRAIKLEDVNASTRREPNPVEVFAAKCNAELGWIRQHETGRR